MVDIISCHIDSLIRRLDNHTVVLPCHTVVLPWKVKPWREKVKRELEHLKIYFWCVERLSYVDEDAGEHVRDLVAAARDAFADVSFDMEDAGQQVTIEACSQLERKIAQFRPKMRDVYAYLSQNFFHARSPVTGIVFWWSILSAVYDSLYAVNLDDPLKEEFKKFNRDLKSLHLYLRNLDDDLTSVRPSTDFWVYVEGVATCAAQLSYLAWLDGMDPIKSQDLIPLVSDLHQMITPTNSKTINVYFRLFKALGSIIDVTIVTKKVDEFLAEWVLTFDRYRENISLKRFLATHSPHIYRFITRNGGNMSAISLALVSQFLIATGAGPLLLLHINDSRNVGGIDRAYLKRFLASHLSCMYRILPNTFEIENVRSGLKFLILFLIYAPDKFSYEVKFIWLDTETVFAKAVSCSSLARSKSDLYQLLGKIEILKAEAVLMGLMNKNLENKTPILKSSKALCKGVKMLQGYSKKPPMGINDKGKLILKTIEAVATKCASLYDKFDANPVNKDDIRDVLKLLVNIKLLKAQLFWLELLNKDTTSNDNIEVILGGLEFQRKFVSGNATGNSESGKLILGHVDEVSCKAMSIYHSFPADEGAEKLVEEMKNWIAEHAKYVYVGSSCFNFPKTNGLGSLDFLLENLRKLLNTKTDFSSPVKDLIESVLMKDLELLRSFLCETAKQCKVHQELEILHKRIIHMAYEADYTIDSIVLRNGDVWYHTSCLSDIIEDIKLIKAEVEKKTYAIEAAPVTQILRDKTFPIIKEDIISLDDQEDIISLDDQEEIIIDQLTRGSERRDTISIVGMGGIGKTTLANKVFNNHMVKRHFHVCAWCSVSATYNKRDLLLEILSYVPEQNDELDKDTVDDDDIAHKLQQRLMGRKYLIVMDDLWDIQAWNDMQMSFPEQSNGSRILFTSRDSEIVSKAGGTRKPHPLRGLSETESWKLLEAKAFHGKVCSQELEGIGKIIATGCEGLPIAVIAIGGLLERTDKTLGWWKEIAEDINMHIAEDRESRCMSILGLSYKHLPDHLKPCFLYFGAFQGNKEILVRKLLRLWISEGFLTNDDPGKSIEDVAEGYLTELIRRSLVIVTKERSQGGLKACQVHDLLRELCKSKAEEDNFLLQIKGYDKKKTSSSCYADNPITYKKLRLSICSQRDDFAMLLKPSGHLVRSLLFFPTVDPNPMWEYDVSIISNNFRLLRVLDLEDVNMGASFPCGIELLKRLRYLALSGFINSVPSTLAEIWNLETLLVKGLKGRAAISIPVAIMSMESLRHLHVNDIATFDPQERESMLPCNLVTLSSASLSCGEVAENLMKRLLDLKKLRCIFGKPHDRDHSVECKRSPMLSFLTKLESLKVSYYDDIHIPSSCEYYFGSSLRKLSISCCRLLTKHICTIGKLPNLQVLKLISVAFDDQTLDMSQEGGFASLNYLKLENLSISVWNAESDHLPVLNRLVLRNCKKLEEVSSSFGESATLQIIELQWCSQTAESSVKEIHNEQFELRNEGEFKLFIDLLEYQGSPEQVHEIADACMDEMEPIRTSTSKALEAENKALKAKVKALEAKVKTLEAENKALQDKNA